MHACCERCYPAPYEAPVAAKRPRTSEADTKKRIRRTAAAVGLYRALRGAVAACTRMHATTLHRSTHALPPAGSWQERSRVAVGCARNAAMDLAPARSGWRECQFDDVTRCSARTSARLRGNARPGGWNERHGQRYTFFLTTAVPAVECTGYGRKSRSRRPTPAHRAPCASGTLAPSWPRLGARLATRGRSGAAARLSCGALVRSGQRRRRTLSAARSLARAGRASPRGMLGGVL